MILLIIWLFDEFIKFRISFYKFIDCLLSCLRIHRFSNCVLIDFLYFDDFLMNWLFVLYERINLLKIFWRNYLLLYECIDFNWLFDELIDFLMNLWWIYRWLDIFLMILLISLVFIELSDLLMIFREFECFSLKSTEF